jgi:hypothetical protein
VGGAFEAVLSEILVRRYPKRAHKSAVKMKRREASLTSDIVQAQGLVERGEHEVAAPEEAAVKLIARGGARRLKPCGTATTVAMKREHLGANPVKFLVHLHILEGAAIHFLAQAIETRC